MGEATVKASSWRMVERGRVVLFTTGKYEGKLAAIAEIIDHKRVCGSSFLFFSTTRNNRPYKYHGAAL